MENQTEIQKNNKETFIDNKSVKELLKFGIKKFNSEIFLANSQNPEANIDSVTDNLEFLEEAITNLDEFSNFVVRDQLKKKDFYYISVCPKDKLVKKSENQYVFDLEVGEKIKEAQIKISDRIVDPYDISPEQVLSRSGFGIEYYVSEASLVQDEKTKEIKLMFDRQDGVGFIIRHDGLCVMYGKKHAGEVDYTTPKKTRIDQLKDKNMPQIIVEVTNQIKSMKIF